VSNFKELSKLVETANGADRTRRNLFKIGAKLGAVAGVAVIASVTRVRRVAAKPNPPGCANPVPAIMNPNCNCFMKGTSIRTVDGERNVEELAVGDVLSTMFGGDRPIQWTGRYSFKKSDPSKFWVKDALPVRIARSALAANVPHTDLFVTQAHHLFIDGALVPAGCLINGTTITLYDAHEYDELEFYHIKLENHDVVYAEGAPCETLLQVDENAANFAEYYRIFGAPTSAAVACAPQLTYNGARSEIKSRLRSALSFWIDRREKIDVIRDHLEERAVLLS
jgi:Hint domain